MRRTTMALFALFAALLLAPEVQAKEWARKMFAVRSHKFGAVARGSKTEFRFELTNLYKEDVHLAAVRTSCGCTTPRIEKATLKSLEKGAVIARFNTNSFLGSKKATITVTIDKPFFAEVQLQVSGYIRSDVVFKPGEVQFGEIRQGKGAERTVSIDYAGFNKWKIDDIRSANEHVEVELAETRRGSGRVGYNMTVRLKPTAPVGYLKDQLAIITNEGNRQSITLPISARVSSLLSVRPSSLLFGDVKPGSTVTKKLVVHGNLPFKIKSIECDDERFQFTASDKERKVHIVPVVLKTDTQLGKIQKRIKILTDRGWSASCVLQAEVRQ